MIKSKITLSIQINQFRPKFKILVRYPLVADEWLYEAVIKRRTVINDRHPLVLNCQFQFNFLLLVYQFTPTGNFFRLEQR